MNYRINVTTTATADIQGIYDQIAEDSPAAAERITDLLNSSIKAAVDFPKRYPLAPESSRESTEIRQMIVGSYRILFRIIGDTLHILRVRHCAQQMLKPGELN